MYSKIPLLIPQDVTPHCYMRPQVFLAEWIGYIVCLVQLY